MVLIFNILTRTYISFFDTYIHFNSININTKLFYFKEDTVKNKTLDQITSLKLQAPMSVNRLCMLSTYVPNLVELDLTESFLPSFRL